MGRTLSLLLLSVVACGAKAQAPSRTGEIPPLPKGPAGEEACASDADCTLTPASPSSCCRDGCGDGTAVSARYAARLARYLDERCRGGGYQCPVFSCPRALERTVARCSAGACTGVLEPIAVAQPVVPDAGVPDPGPPPPIDGCGMYPVTVTLPPRGCQRDADCTFTAYRPGECHAPLCSGDYRAGSHAWVEAADELHTRACAGFHGVPCKKVKCVNRAPTGVGCEKGACVLRFPE